MKKVLMKTIVKMKTKNIEKHNMKLKMKTKLNNNKERIK